MSTTATPTLSNARLRVLTAVRDLGGEHVTIATLTNHLGGHPNASRPHLAALVSAGLLTVADVPGSGPGRRPRGHTLTDEGRQALNPPTTETVGLTGAFASYLVQTGHGAEDARKIGQIWGEQQAVNLPETSVQDSVAAVVEVLDILGFDPAPLEVEEGQALVLRTCPLLTSSSPSDPSFICEVHHGLIDGVLRRIGAKEGVTLLPFAEPSGCRVEMEHPNS